MVVVQVKAGVAFVQSSRAIRDLGDALTCDMQVRCLVGLRGGAIRMTIVACRAECEVVASRGPSRWWFMAHEQATLHSSCC